ncbi:uncharacterized protein LOC126656897 [Mercurialis annua]|uniref:uncharacterized protein LOC126656897 n=1 Tax=Mercurialis annua TaxID=3986 RepID=UPI00215F6828|nr:uncharacterized protein LOC126656897 [Mercurialis annua]
MIFKEQDIETEATIESLEENFLKVATTNADSSRKSSAVDLSEDRFKELQVQANEMLCGEHWEFEAKTSGLSDHSPIITYNHNDNRKEKRRSFRYINLWTKHPNYDEIIEEWRKDYPGFIMFQIRVKVQRDMLDQIQKDVQLNPFNCHLLAEERAMNYHLRYLLLCEESFLKQKSRIQWLTLGDSNTNFFHNSIKQKRIKNNVSILKLEIGESITDQDEIHKEMTRFYKHPFKDNN